MLATVWSLAPETLGLAARRRAALVLALCPWACANPLDTRVNVFDAASASIVTQDAAAAGGQAAGDGTTAGACGCLEVGQVYRFDDLTLETLDGGPHPAVGQLNDKWGADIDQHLLNVLFEVTEVTPERIRVHALNGANDREIGAESVCRLESTGVDFDLERDGCTFTMAVSAGIHIFVGTTAATKNCAPDLAVPNAIPIDRVRLGFSLTSDCSALTDGRVLEASLPKAALGRICTCLSDDIDTCSGPAAQPGCGGCAGSYFNLESLLLALGRGAAPAYGCKDAEEGPALCLEARFTGERLPARLDDCSSGDGP